MLTALFPVEMGRVKNKIKTFKAKLKIEVLTWKPGQSLVFL